MPVNFTHGGLPEPGAWHWNKETYQKLGHIVFLLNSGDQRERYSGYCEFFSMRRMFMSQEWDAQIKRIDDFREEKGHKAISEIVNDARGQMIDHGTTSGAIPGDPAMPGEVEAVIHAKTEGAQLSLF